jgi:hypothetical protein
VALRCCSPISYFTNELENNPLEKTMNNFNEEQTPVTRQLVAEDQRLAVTASLFGPHFPLQIEPVVYGIAEQMAEDYCGGYWKFYKLGNDGFYMAPDEEGTFEIKCQNYYSGTLSPDAFGVVCCMYAFSHLSFQGDFFFGRTCAKHYHLLRHFMMDHAEVAAILEAID